jgi:hypothetical protein
MAKVKEASTTASVDLTRALMHGSSGIKKKIRDISRLLSKDNLSADVKIANERALKTLKLELEKVQTDQKTKKLVQRYHKVRFFEKKKSIRFYKKSEKIIKDIEIEISNTTDETEIKELKKKLKKEKRIFEHCKVDLAYVLNFPRNEKYISLYAKTEIPENLPKKAKDGIKKTNLKRESLKKMLSDQLQKNELEISLEDGIKGEFDNNRMKINNNKKKSNVDDVDKKQGGGEGEEEEDDFFE